MDFVSHNEYGHDNFLRAYQTLAIPAERRAQAVARWLDVQPATVARWISGRAPVPRAVAYAVWLESQAGRRALADQLAGELHWTAGHVSALADRCAGLELTIQRLRTELAELAAARSDVHTASNDKFFDDVPGPRRQPYQRA